MELPPPLGDAAAGGLAADQGLERFIILSLKRS